MPISFSETAPSSKDFLPLFETTGWNSKYHATAEELAQALSHSRWIVAVHDDGRLVGFGRVVTDMALHAMIYDLIVAPEYRNRGVGTQILAALVKKCLQANIRDIQLFCARGQQGFYEKRGFVARPSDAPGMQFRRNPQPGGG